MLIKKYILIICIKMLRPIKNDLFKHSNLFGQSQRFLYVTNMG